MEAVLQPAPLAGEHEDWLHRLGVSLSASKWSESLQGIVGKLALNTPLDLEDGVVLFNHPDLHELGALANAVRGALWSPSVLQLERPHQPNEHLRSCLSLLCIPSRPQGR